MILADTSIWIDHLRRGDAGLAAQLMQAQVLMHPCVLGELAVGNIKDRQTLMPFLSSLPRAISATDAEVLIAIEQKKMSGRGIGYTDAHLLTSVLLMPGTRLWTRDRRLRALAQVLHLDSGLA